jgi:enamine deaminase RidA (YjgF/YER057c/UK114 family)
VLNEANLDESDVVKLYIYYHTPDDWQKVEEASRLMRDITREFYPQPGPCATAFRVSGFAFEDLLVEIEAMAVTRE